MRKTAHLLVEFVALSMKNFYLLILLLTLITHADAQMEYRVIAGAQGGFHKNIGSDLINLTPIGLFASLGFNKKTTKRLSLCSEIELNFLFISYNSYSLFDSIPPLIQATTRIITAQRQLGKLNLVSELTYSLANFLSIGVGVYNEYIVVQKNKTFLLETSNEFEAENKFSPISVGLTGNIRWLINTDYIQFKYLHGLTNAATYHVYDEGVKVKTKLKSRTFQLGIGCNF